MYLLNHAHCWTWLRRKGIVINALELSALDAAINHTQNTAGTKKCNINAEGEETSLVAVDVSPLTNTHSSLQ